MTASSFLVSTLCVAHELPKYELIPFSKGVSQGAKVFSAYLIDRNQGAVKTCQATHRSSGEMKGSCTTLNTFEDMNDIEFHTLKDHRTFQNFPGNHEFWLLNQDTGKLTFCWNGTSCVDVAL